MEPVTPDGLTVRQVLAWLEAAYPAWHVWYVPTWDGTRQGMIWCAKRHRDGCLLHGDTPAHLAEYVAEAGFPADR